MRAGRATRLGVALVGLAQELATARREIAVIKRDNARLRATIDSGAHEHETATYDRAVLERSAPRGQKAGDLRDAEPEWSKAGKGIIPSTSRAVATRTG